MVKDRVTWSQAFRKLAWIPIILTLLHIGSFIYDAIHNGSISSALVNIYLINYVISIVIFYFGIVTYFVYTMRAAVFILTIIFVLFGFCSLKNSPISDAVRNYVDAHINFEYFVGFLTVAALLVALIQIFQEQQEKYKYSLYFPPNNKNVSNQPSAIIIAQKQQEDKKKHKKR